MLIAYHGTPRSSFDTLKLGEKPTSKQLYGYGLYFTSDRRSALAFAKGRQVISQSLAFSILRGPAGPPSLFVVFLK